MSLAEIYIPNTELFIRSKNITTNTDQQSNFLYHT